MSITAAQGFIASGLHAGVKKKRYDMALVATDDGKPVTAAAVFTQNKFFAPPVGAARGRGPARPARCPPGPPRPGTRGQGHWRRRTRWPSRSRR